MRIGQRKAFQEPMKVRSMTVMIAGRAIGKQICHKKRKCPEPSKRAASHSSSGIWAKNCLSKKILKALAKKGTVKPQIEFIHEPPKAIKSKLKRVLSGVARI